MLRNSHETMLSQPSVVAVTLRNKIPEKNCDNLPTRRTVALKICSLQIDNVWGIRVRGPPDELWHRGRIGVNAAAAAAAAGVVTSLLCCFITIWASIVLSLDGSVMVPLRPLGTHIVHLAGRASFVYSGSQRASAVCGFAENRLRPSVRATDNLRVPTARPRSRLSAPVYCHSAAVRERSSC